MPVNKNIPATPSMGQRRVRRRIMAKKLQAVNDSFGVRKAIWKIADYGNRELYLKSNLD